jgi:LmbE family N-acetylglucosaminyl deacetylase
VSNNDAADGGTIALAVGAHPDDLEEVCGGTLALLVRAGASVHMACVTGGECGIEGLAPAQVRETRLGEAAASAEIAGASGFHYLGLEDFCFDSEAIRQCQLRLIRLIRDVRANLLITHAPADYHADHRLTHELVVRARIASAIPNVGGGDRISENPDLVFMDTALGVEFHPEVWVDISDVIETKQAMIAAHESQKTFVHGQRLEDLAEVLGRFRGWQRGCAYAEAFRGCGMWPAPDGGIRRLVRLLEREAAR